MSFWKVDSKLAIAQKSVSVPSENGLSYTENQKIVIKIDPSVEYFQPSESYVQFRLKLTKGSLAYQEKFHWCALPSTIRRLCSTISNVEEVDETMVAV